MPETGVLNWRPREASTEEILSSLGPVASRTNIAGEAWVRQVRREHVRRSGRYLVAHRRRSRRPGVMTGPTRSELRLSPASSAISDAVLWHHPYSIVISTRRFCARPAGVLLSATGSFSPLADHGKTGRVVDTLADNPVLDRFGASARQPLIVAGACPWNRHALRS